MARTRQTAANAAELAEAALQLGTLVGSGRSPQPVQVIEQKPLLAGAVGDGNNR
jgi:hypothetical protein